MPRLSFRLVPPPPPSPRARAMVFLTALTMLACLRVLVDRAPRGTSGARFPSVWGKRHG